MKTDGATRLGFQNRGRSFAGYRLGWETSKKFRKIQLSGSESQILK